jgi:hypothetical protein
VMRAGMDFLVELHADGEMPLFPPGASQQELSAGNKRTVGGGRPTSRKSSSADKAKAGI